MLRGEREAKAVREREKRTCNSLIATFERDLGKKTGLCLGPVRQASLRTDLITNRPFLSAPFYKTGVRQPLRPFLKRTRKHQIRLYIKGAPELFF